MDYAKEHFYIREFEMNAQTPQVLVEDGIPASGKIKDPCLVKTGGAVPGRADKRA